MEDLKEVNNNISDAIDQLEEKISLEQIKTNKKVDKLEEKIEKLGTKVITVEAVTEVNNNISEAIDQLKDEMKTFILEKYSENGCNESNIANIADENKDRTNLAEDHNDTLNHVVQEVEEKGKNIICLPT